MKPIAIPTRETVAFLLPHLNLPTNRILEIGSGAGDVAATLAKKGFDVTAIDPNAEMVDLALKKGVQAQIASWPDFHDPQPFDAIIFTRSLHHLGKLEPAIHQAWKSLKPNGWLLVEDFAFNETTHSTMAWFYQILSLLKNSGNYQTNPESFVNQFLEAEGAPEAWCSNHGHDLHSATSMRNAIDGIFPKSTIVPAPYLYRYCLQVLPTTDAGARMLDNILALEKHLGTQNDQYFIGRRFTAQKPAP